MYCYSVHDYSNRSSTQSTALSSSGAQVKVYRGNTLLNTYNVSVNTKGTLWTVFEIEDGVINPVNTMEYQSDPAAVD